MTYQPTFMAYLNSFSASRCNHKGHRESAYVMVNRRKTLPNTYLELAEYQDSSCRLLRHSKIFAPVHSLNWNSTLSRVHCPIGTQSVKSLPDIIYIASCQKPDIACSGLHSKEASHRIYCLSSTWLTLSRPSSWPQNVWHWRALLPHTILQTNGWLIV